MSEIILRDICKSYENGFQAVKDFNLEIEKGELVVFVGPSGCGKSTTLRMIAGLEDISDGELWIGDKTGQLSGTKRARPCNGFPELCSLSADEHLR